MGGLVLPCRGGVISSSTILGLLSSSPFQGLCGFTPVQRLLRCTTTYTRRFLSFKRSKEVNRRFICSVVTEPLPTQAEELNMDTPKEIFLRDYKKPDYYFDTVDLKYLLDEEKTHVFSTITVFSENEGSSPSPLVLVGSDLKLISIKVNGVELKEEEFHVDSRHLRLPSPPSATFTLEIVTEIYPHYNTSLEGLYKSSGNFCTQCEAEGFRKITFFQDRPDIMAKYTVRIEADKSRYPVLLSNGNLIGQGDIELESRDDTFITRSGREVSLRIWTPSKDLPKTAHAMYSLKAAMKWDEDVFGLEYDLDLFNIVAVPDFNMGAMENKSLNIFNSKLVLASPETATDGDYAAILGVIGHEYFHNWTGNRVTCRDWFQLSLKEGLTVFRDQEFSSDMGSRAVQRIADVSTLRNYQYPQDAGPMAHPVRPHSYIKSPTGFSAVAVHVLPRMSGVSKWIDESELQWEKDVIMEMLASKKNMDKAYIDLVKRNEKLAKGLMILCIAIVFGCIMLCISKLG
ncbi:hypothetical protein KSS87_011575 [Heliosperma pusillum]|nr:hypothetical protein KSS87_011575 [Heliosperma pusillum]